MPAGLPSESGRMALLEVQLPSDHQSVASRALQRPQEGHHRIRYRIRRDPTLPDTSPLNGSSPFENQDLICRRAQNPAMARYHPQHPSPNPPGATFLHAKRLGTPPTLLRLVTRPA